MSQTPKALHMAISTLQRLAELFMERRQQAKRRGERHADQAIKIMMNALFGVLGSASCRFFDPDVANAITSFGQQTLHWTRDAFEQEGVAVIYGDTDSVFVRLAAKGSAILLIEDGVYCATRPGDPAVSAIADDVAARGLGSRIDDSVTLISFENFVDLVVSHQPVVSWS